MASKIELPARVTLDGVGLSFDCLRFRATESWRLRSFVEDLGLKVTEEDLGCWAVYENDLVIGHIERHDDESGGFKLEIEPASFFVDEETNG